MLSGVECRRGSRCGAGAACVVSVLSAVTENKAFDLPAYAERGGEWFLGDKRCGRSRGFCCVCFGDVVI